MAVIFPVRIAVAAVLLSMATGANQRGKPTLRLSRQDLTLFGLTIGTSSQADVEKRLGKSEVFRTSRAEHADDALCYVSAANDDDTAVVFFFGALGGWTDLTQISVSWKGELPNWGRSCSKNTLVSRRIDFLRGLRLGASREDVLRRLGPASRSSEHGLFYYVSHKCLLGKRASSNTQTSDDDSPCVVVDSVTAKFKGGRLVRITFYQFVDK